MEQRIHGHFREAQCMMIILEKPVAFVVKITKKKKSRLRVPPTRVTDRRHSNLSGPAQVWLSSPTRPEFLFWE
jgi:hypothetical protein